MLNPTPLPPNGPVTWRTFASQRPGTVFPATSRAIATYDSQGYHNLGAQGLQLVIDLNSGSGTVTVSILARDPATGEFVAMTGAVTTALSGTSQTIFTLYPGITEAANVKVSQLLPHEFKIRAAVATNTLNFSIGGTLLP